MPEQHSPVHRIARGALQTIGSAYVARLVNWVATILLLRLLDPAEFGDVELATVVVAMVISLRNLGLHLALLHEHDHIDELAPTHFLLNMGLGAAGTLLASIVAFFFYEGIVATVLLIFAGLDLLRNALWTSEVQIRRDLDFGRLAFSHASATVLASIVALAVAFLTHSVWALILGYSVYSVGYVTVYATLIWTRRPPRLPRPGEFNSPGARKLMHYGVRFWMGGILQVFIQSYDRFLVGTLLGSNALGFYGRAHQFAQIPTGAVTHTIISVTSTVYARYQNNRTQLSAAYRRALRFILRAATPASLILAVEAPTLIPFLADEKWMPVAPLLQMLVVYSLCRPVLEDLYALFQGLGDLKGIILFASVQAGLLIVLVPLLIQPLGPIGAAIGMDLAVMAGLALAVRRATRYVDVPWLRTALPPLLSATAALAVRLAVGRFIEPLSPPLAILSGIVCFSLVYAAVLLALEGRTLLDEFRTVRNSFRKEMVPPVESRLPPDV